MAGGSLVAGVAGVGSRVMCRSLVVGGEHHAGTLIEGDMSPLVKLGVLSHVSVWNWLLVARVTSTRQCG